MSEAAAAFGDRLAAPRPSRSRARLFALLAALALFALVPAAAQAFDNPFLVRLFLRIMIMAVAAVSLDIILGYGGMISLGHAAFMGVGAYVVGIMDFHVTNSTPLLTWPFVLDATTNAYVVWPLAIVASALAAFFVGAVSLRTTGLYFCMITLAFAQMLFYLFVSLRGYGGDDGMQLTANSELWPIDLGRRLTLYYTVLGALALCLLLAARLVRSRFGMVLQGTRDNERRLRAIGFATYRYKLAAFTISGAMAGLSGVLLANAQLFVSPADLSWTRSADLLIMVILGGVGSLIGPVIGAAVYVILDLIVGGYTIHWQVIFGPVLILAVLFVRGGLAGLAGLSGRDSHDG